MMMMMMKNFINYNSRLPLTFAPAVVKRLEVGRHVETMEILA